MMAVQLSFAQTDIDAVMMGKKDFCSGLVFAGSSWKNYWEGTNKRDNANLGTVSSKNYIVQGNYGISNKLNVLFSMPYVTTNASGGTLQGMKGLQDLSLFVKYMPVKKELGPGSFSVYTIAGISFPTTNYVADFLPLSIGLHSTNLSFRGMVDYQIDNWFATLSGTYVQRSNVKIDRTSYYTTELHYTNEVSMPNATSFNFRTGFRNEKLIAEAILNNWTTQGGFDISKNNMPFLSNTMNMTTIGFNAKVYIPKVDGLYFMGGYNYTVAGRNVGQASNYNAGFLYILSFGKQKKSTPDNNRNGVEKN